MELEKLRVILPEEEGSGKFIQIYVNIEGKEIPIFASKGQPFPMHSTILSEILDELNIGYEVMGHFKIPSEKGENYRIIGAGKMSLKEGKVKIDSRSPSYDYGKSFNEEHFEQIKDYFPEGLEVIVA